MSIQSTIESILFVSIRPLSIKKLARFLEIQQEEVFKTLQSIQKIYEQNNHGIRLIQNNNEWQMVTLKENAPQIKKFLQLEAIGELTRPSLETLTVIAYRGPVTKSEIELIRGVNCSLILRNLMIRGLVEEEYDNQEKEKYRVTMDFMRFLGITKIQELPQYEELNQKQSLEKLLQETKEEKVTQKTKI